MLISELYFEEIHLCPVKMRNRLHLEQVHFVLAVYAGLHFRVIANTCAYVLVECGVSEAEVVLIALSAKTVGRCLNNQLMWQTQFCADGNHLLHGKAAKRGEVTGCVAVTGGIAYPVLRQIAGVCHTAVNRLGDGIDGGHAQTGWHIDDGLLAHFFVESAKLLFHSCHTVSAGDLKNGASYLGLMWANTESVKEALG